MQITADRKSQSGQAVVIVGAMIIALTILATMVFDVGLVFHWVCGLNAIAGQPYQGSLVR